MTLASRLVPAVIAALVVTELTIGVVDGATRAPLGFSDGPVVVRGGPCDPTMASAGTGRSLAWIAGVPANVHRVLVGSGSAAVAPAVAAIPRSVSPTRIAAPLSPTPPVTVPILYYHKASAIPKDFASWPAHSRERFLDYDVIPPALAAQLDWLVANGYTAILPRDLAEYWDHGVPLPAKPVVITFDDGFHNWASTVLPLLQERHMVAEFYLTLDAIRAHGIGWPEVRALVAAGNGIGAHDDHHVQLAGLGPGRDASDATMRAEVTRARQVIFEHTGVLPDSMAYVGGGYNARLMQIAQEAGYSSARTIVRGIVQTEDRRFAMRVVRIGPHDDVADLMSGTMVPGLPTFVARMNGVSDHTRF